MLLKFELGRKKKFKMNVFHKVRSDLSLKKLIDFQSTNKSSAIWHTNTNSFLVINHVHYSMQWLMAFHVIWTFALSNLPCLAVIVDNRIKQ